MKLWIRQKIFSWLDSYHVYDGNGNTAYTVRGQLSWGHYLKIYDSTGKSIAAVRERKIRVMPKFDVYKKGKYIGCVTKRISFLGPRYDISWKKWYLKGSVMEWNYVIQDIASIHKKIISMTDIYEIETVRDEDALDVLLIVIAVDAANCTRGKD